MRAHFTPQAEIDLEEVGDYIALDNPRRAVSFIREIRQHCEKIADGQNAGNSTNNGAFATLDRRAWEIIEFRRRRIQRLAIGRNL
jgi:plasmid stabilization system protein ParE